MITILVQAILLLQIVRFLLKKSLLGLVLGVGHCSCVFWSVSVSVAFAFAVGFVARKNTQQILFKIFQNLEYSMHQTLISEKVRRRKRERKRERERKRDAIIILCDMHYCLCTDDLIQVFSITVTVVYLKLNATCNNNYCFNLLIMFNYCFCLHYHVC